MFSRSNCESFVSSGMLNFVRELKSEMAVNKVAEHMRDAVEIRFSTVAHKFCG